MVRGPRLLRFKVKKPVPKAQKLTIFVVNKAFESLLTTKHLHQLTLILSLPGVSFDIFIGSKKVRRLKDSAISIVYYGFPRIIGNKRIRQTLTKGKL
jgi:hypothetical protein